MNRKKRTNYFSIGIFVLTGLVLVITALLVFGSKAFFQNVMYAETYFNESVQGLSVGSPVKYLGMNVGHVVDITTVSSVYTIANGHKGQRESRYIYIKMAIEPRFFNASSPSDLEKQLNIDVLGGLRVKLALQGLTGNAYLELDFVDLHTVNALPVYWKSKYCYIPSIRSTLTYFSDSAQLLIEKLRKIDFDALFTSINDLVKVTKQTAHSTNKLLGTTNRQIMDIVSNLQIMTQNMNTISERAQNYPSSLFFGKAPPKLDLNKL